MLKKNLSGRVWAAIVVAAILIAAVLLYNASFDKMVSVDDSNPSEQNTKKDNPDYGTQIKTVTNSTKTWLPYTSSSIGVSFKVPPGWSVDEYVPGKAMSEPWASYNFLLSYTVPHGQDHQGYIAVSTKSLSEIKNILCGEDYVVQERAVEFKGYSAIEISCSHFHPSPTPQFSGDMLLVRNGLTYHITGQSSDSDPSIEKAHRELLASLRFQ